MPAHGPDVPFSAQGQGRVQFGADNLQRPGYARRPRSGEPIEVGAPDIAGLRAQGLGLEHILA